MDELLAGGVANAGAVVRRGDQVLKPAPANATAIHALLRYVRERGFEGVPEPFAIDSDGRERLSFIAGDVPVPPFPAWAQSDETLASTAALLRRFHDAAEGFVPPPEADWNTDLADPSGGPRDLPQRRLPGERGLPRRCGGGVAGLRVRRAGQAGARPVRAGAGVHPAGRRA